MVYQLRDITHSAFFELLITTLNAANALFEKDAASADEIKNVTDALITQVQEHLRSHISPDVTDILSILSTSYSHRLEHDYSFYDFHKEPAEREESQRLGKFKHSLAMLIGYLKTINTLVDIENPPKIESISDKSDFILSKLYIVFSADFYSIHKILEMNNIEFRSKEAREIAEDLHRRGYVTLESRWGESSLAKISIKGASYVERKSRLKKNTKSNVNLEKKLDNVLEHLIKLGHGQEIIFDEIGELKELQHTLSQKTWSQLLKGKLLDLALDKIISTETATFVYEYLTNSNLKLLKFP